MRMLIGSEYSGLEWTDPVYDLLIDAGIPEDFARFCYSAPLHGKPRAGDVAAVLRVGGDSKRRSVEELEYAIELGLGLKLDLPDETDLAPLISVLSRVKWLAMGSSHGKPRLRGWETLKVAADLRALTVVARDPDRDIDLSQLPHLRRFSANSAQRFLSVLRNESIEHVSLDDIEHWGDIEYIAAPLRSLQLRDTTKLVHIPVLVQPELLEWFWIDGARELDLAWFGAATSLQRMTIYGCKRLRNGDALRGLPGLRWLELSGVGAFEEWEALGDLPNLEWFRLGPNGFLRPEDAARIAPQAAKRVVRPRRAVQ